MSPLVEFTRRALGRKIKAKGIVLSIALLAWVIQKNDEPQHPVTALPPFI